jgi:seryl-tRNA synthetase
MALTNEMQAQLAAACDDRFEVTRRGKQIKEAQKVAKAEKQKELESNLLLQKQKTKEKMQKLEKLLRETNQKIDNLLVNRKNLEEKIAKQKYWLERNS